MLLVLVGALAWSAGSVHARSVDLPANPFMATAMQMLAGGILLVLTGLLLGEGRHFDVAALSLRSFFAWSYLAVFGSFIAFSAYVWLLKNATPALASTYAYVNPVVAVLLGWALAGEPLTVRIVVSIILLISAIVLTSRGSRSKKRKIIPKPAPTRTPVPGHSTRTHPVERARADLGF